MTKLNQIIALTNGEKARAQKTLAEIYHKIQKEDLLSGISRTYRPKDEDGERQPPESKRVQYRARTAIYDASKCLEKLFNLVATQDHNNCAATASVSIDGETILPDVPISHLLFLEKQLVELRAFVAKIPTLDPAEEWTYSDEVDCFATKTTETVRTKKIPRNHVKAEATREHPAQVEVWMEDVQVGYWDTRKFSGAIPETDRNAMLKRVDKLQDAVKSAREAANAIEVNDYKSSAVLDYIFNGTAQSQT